jgi:competence protein ComEC
LYKQINFVLVLGIISFFVLNAFGFLVFAMYVFIVFLFLRKHLLFNVVLFILILGRFILWTHFPPDHLVWMNDDLAEHNIVGTVCFEPDVRREDVRYIVCVDSIDYQDAKGKLLVKANLFPRFEYGDELEMKGHVETPFEEKEFSYKNYLQIFGVNSLLKATSGPWLLEEGHNFGNTIFKFKNDLIRLIEFKLQEPASSLVGGVLLGIRKGFSDQIMEEFNITGLTHIIAVSGYNVSLIILVFNRLFPFIPRQIRFYLISVFLFLFMAITGFTASVIRAVIMGIISLAALEVGERNMFLRVILLTALIMALFNPALLLYDAGFHLSFLSTLGVVYLAQYLSMDWLTESLGIREAFVLTIAAQLATLPIVIFNFGRISLVSPLANLLVAPLVPLSMLFGFLLILFSWSQFLTFIFVILTSTISFLLFLLINLSSKIPFAAVDFEKGKIEYVLMYFLLVFIVAFIFRKRKFVEV